MRKLFISRYIPDSISSMLCSMGFSLVYLPPEPSLPEPVSAHADMLFFENILQRDYYERNKELFLGCDVILAEEKFGKEYPKDVLLNAFVIGDTLFGRLDSLSDKVKQRYPNMVNLKQGYAKCSTLLFANNAITSDKGIADTLTKHGVKTLLISPGNILLLGYDYGFIGGASLVFENKIVFFGNIEAHPDYKKIKSFTNNKGYELIFDTSVPMTDLGGGIIM